MMMRRRVGWNLITSEYPPQAGGVSDYTRLVAEELAAAGEDVEVWCPSLDGDELATEDAEANAARGVSVRREFGKFHPADLRRVGRLLDAGSPAPRRLLVEYVPHGFGYRSMNVWFCLWLWKRAKLSGDEVEVVVHEPYLAFGEGNWRQDAAAAVHRVMAALLLRAARRVWVTIPAWETALRPFALGRRVPFAWLPVPSAIPVVEDEQGTIAARARYTPEGGALIGHFGTYSASVARTFSSMLPALLEGDERGGARSLLLLGRGSEETRAELIRAHPAHAARVHATGMLALADVSRHLRACDLLVQPYPDGVSARRTSAMAGLAHGLAVVTTRGRLTETLWEESGAVALVAAGDADELAECVGRLLDDDTERARLGAAALALYRERFDVSRVVAALRGAERTDAAGEVDAALAGEA